MTLAFYLLIILSGMNLFLIGYFLTSKRKPVPGNELILQQVFNHSIPICITNTDHEIITANDAYWSFWSKPDPGEWPVKCYENRPGKSCHTEDCPLTRIVGGDEEYTCEPKKERDGVLHHFIVTAKPLFDENKKTIGVIEYFQDITERKKAEEVKSELIENLEESLREANVLSGFLPICASCKKIRDDKGYWNQIELYISQHSHAEFTHGICPDCLHKLYPQYASGADGEKRRD